MGQQGVVAWFVCGAGGDVGRAVECVSGGGGGGVRGGRRAGELELNDDEKEGGEKGRWDEDFDVETGICHEKRRGITSEKRRREEIEERGKEEEGGKKTKSRHGQNNKEKNQSKATCQFPVFFSLSSSFSAS